MIDPAARYLPALDSLMRDVVNAAPEAPGFGVLLRYPLGWADTDGRSADRPAGKRIRPLLLLLCAEAAGGDWEAALPAAAAVELLHNFSLIHDDIEDASPTRHGQPTVWQQWGVATAINAGDAMFTLAYAALERLSATTTPELALKAWGIFNRMALELTRGQHLDMAFEKQPVVTVDDYLTMIEGKSAALVAASAELGALISSGQAETAAHFREFGLNLGLAFQIRDDILGIWGDPAVTGKSAATDILSRKKSLPALFGLQHSPALRALYAREPFGEPEVAEAIALLETANALEYAEGLETQFHERAVSALALAGASGPAANALRGLLDTLLGRAA